MRFGEFTSRAMISALADIGRDSVATAWVLIRITVPVIILTKILELAGLIVYFSRLLEPVMKVVGLPGEMGLVWATGMLTNLYGAVAVFAAIAPGLDLTAAQATVIASMLLLAHSLPVELVISRQAGAGALPIGLLRVGGALVFGALLYWGALALGVWQQPAHLYFQGGGGDQTLARWALDQVRNLGLILVVIFGILAAMRLLRACGLLGLLERLLEPLLPPFGMTRRAAPLTVVGMVLGLAYGGALIIRETTAGTMDRREIFNSLALMALSHGLIEDTLLMLALGAKLGGILWGRLLFSLAVLYLLVRLMDRLAPPRRRQ